MKIIEAKNLSFQRQGDVILDNVSLDVLENDFVTLIGPNGAGKSILLECIMGLTSPDSGEIKRSAGLRIGYIPQKLTADAVIPITVEKFLRLRRKTSLDSITALAEEIDVQHVLDTPLSALSQGELQRILLVRALSDEPQLLVMDEPAQNLDITGQLSFYKLLRKIYKEKKLSILMVSHDLHMVMSSSKKVVCLYKHICCSGEPKTVTKDPAFISLFGNDMADMMAVYQHSHDHTHG